MRVGGCVEQKKDIKGRDGVCPCDSSELYRRTHRRLRQGNYLQIMRIGSIHKKYLPKNIL